MNASRFQSFLGRILSAPLSTWVLLGFGISYCLFFVRPIFLASNAMHFYQYVPAAEHIGIDLKQTLSFSEYWLAPDKLQYVRSNNYPPLISLLFVPLLGLKFPVAFALVTWLSVLAYAVVTLILARSMTQNRDPSSLPAVICLGGLLSYGFQFELERGQFDLLTILPALLAVWIFHRHSSHRWAAYLLFSLSVQMKLYPLVFVVMFVHDWREWKDNLRRLALLILANVAFLLAFGATVVTSFMRATAAYIEDPYVWVGNHSIQSAVTLALRFAGRHGWAWLDSYSTALQVAALALVACCLLLIVINAFRKNRVGLNEHLLLALTLSALLVPSFSHDYRLTILAAPTVALLLAEQLAEPSAAHRKQAVRIPAILVLGFAYSSTFFSYAQKPFIFANNAVALMAMLLAVTVLAFLQGPQSRELTLS